MVSPDNEQALIAKRKELLKCTEAEAALNNPSIVEYFEEVRAQALDAMLNPSLDTDEKVLWRIRTIAQTVDKLFSYLNETADMRQYVEDEIKALEGRP